MESSGETFPFLISWEKLKNYKEYDEELQYDLCTCEREECYRYKRIL